MNALKLDTSVKAFLTATVTNKDNTVSSYLCDLDGKPLPSGADPLPIFRDFFSGATYVRVAENVPVNTDPASKLEAERIARLNPIHYHDDSVRGWFILAPDHNGRDKVVAPADPVETVPVPVETPNVVTPVTGSFVAA
jgi:hypothetical protein